MVGVPDGVQGVPPDPPAALVVSFDEHAVRTRTEAATRAARCGGRNLRDMRTPSDRPVHMAPAGLLGSGLRWSGQPKRGDRRTIVPARSSGGSAPPVVRSSGG